MGGSASVWTICLLFFQVLLLFGYLFAHLLDRISVKPGSRIYLSLLLMAVFILFVIPGPWEIKFIPDPETPVCNVLFLLFVYLGLPFFLLSASGPLIQSWFSKFHNTASPYSLYAVFNTGSLLALLVYPFVIEPLFTLHKQAMAWAGILAVFILSIVYKTFRINFSQDFSDLKPQSALNLNENRPNNWMYLYYIGLAACSSLMLMSITNRLTTHIAPVPLLWILPLALYLLSFILAFKGDKNPRLFSLPLIFALFAAWIELKLDYQLGLIAHTFILSFVLFTICFFYHSRLYLHRPASRHQPCFYLSLAAGGALGGICVSIICPIVFTGFWEYHLGLLTTGCLGAGMIFSQRQMKYYLRFTLLILITFFIFILSLDLSGQVSGHWARIRNFYGQLELKHSIIDNKKVHTLYYNSIMHGMQMTLATGNSDPMAYFAKNTGVGMAFGSHPHRALGKPLNVGVLGLGIGAMAAYGEQADVFKFYETNPAVVKLASQGPWFTHLRDSKADIDIVLGDGRVSLKKERQTGKINGFDLFIIDAFSGSSIPVHLFTKQAFKLYISHLNPKAIIAVHISNRFLNLENVISSAGSAFGLRNILIDAKSDGYHSSWILLSRDDSFFENRAVKRSGRILSPDPDLPMWTDQHSSLWRALKF